MSFKNSLKKFKDLQTEDFRILLAIEAGMSYYEHVPIDTIIAFSNLEREEALHRIGRCHKLHLIQRRSGAYVGYVLNYTGYDFLALNTLVKGGFLEAIGNSLGLGKEADVFEAITPSKDKVALKFHRIGRTSFRQTRRVRGYVREKVSWFHQSRRAAEKEYEGLKVLFERGVFVPKPITQNRHTIMMGIIEGTELAEYKKLPKPHYFLYDILWNIRKAYTEAHIIHADLSEFNVVIKPDGTVLIIDWPQYVTWDHPNAQQLLKRDVENILKYFRRKFRVKTSFEEAFSYVKGEKEKLD